MATIVTFDVFSALTNSRVGGTAFFRGLCLRHGWSADPQALYDRWDSTNKELHRLEPGWRSFRELSGMAFATTLESFALQAGQASDADDLLDSMADWPLWPDVTAEVFAALDDVRPGLLTNIDDALLATTKVVRLGSFDPELVLTSERLQSYKPAAQFYHAAESAVGTFIHVASSSRDVRGAGSAGLTTIRLARPGHPLDPQGPTPRWTIESLAGLPAAIRASGPSGPAAH